MKALRTLVTLLLCGAVLGLVIETFAGAPASGVQPPASLISMAITAGLPACAADANGDQLVNGADLSVLLAQFGTSVSPGAGADSNNDGVVNGADLSVLLAAFGQPCPECDKLADCPALPNATRFCLDGECGYQCVLGFADCDGLETNGCEAPMAASNTCGTAINLGTFCGDSACGLFCPASSFVTAVTRQGSGGIFYRARASECANCSAPVRHRVRLSVAPGSQYILTVFRHGCGPEDFFDARPALPGSDGVIIVDVADVGASDDSFNYWIGIEFTGGTCGNWTLTVEGTDC